MTISVVTGANSGIGRATAIHLAQQDHTVYGTVRSVEKAAKVQAMSRRRLRSFCGRGCRS